MRPNNPTLREWIQAFDEGKYNSISREIQCDAGWYDWFCKDYSLKNRLYKMAPKVIRIAESPKINQDNMYIWFKNNCPVYGKLYDDFRFADFKTGDTIYTVIPSSGHDSEKGEAHLWGRENDFNEPIVKGKMKDIYKYFEV